MRAISTGTLCVVIIGCLLLASTVSKASLGDDENPGWGISTLIETDNIGPALHPQVAIDDSGNATAVWYQHDGTRNNILANRYVVGVGWGIPTLIEVDNTGDALYPQVAVDGSGNAIAVWYQHDGTRNNIWSNRYVAGVGWGTAELIETDDSGHAYRPQVAFDGSGNAMAVWEHFDFTRSSIWSNRYVVGTGWGTAELIETENLGDALFPQVAVDGSGDATAVWQQLDGVRYNIISNRYVVGTGWGTATLIETENLGSASTPQVAVDGSGYAMAVWYQSDGARNNVWSNRYVVGTGWGTATLIETDDSGNAIIPHVAVDGSGDAMAVWCQWDGTRTNIMSNRYIVGAGWGIPTLIETDNLGDALFPRVAVDGSGDAVVVWYQQDDDIINTNIWSNRYVKPDTTPPSLSLDRPSDGLTTEAAVVEVSGTTESDVALSINGILVAVESDGSFSCTIALVEGSNTITATATDASDNSATVSVSVTYINPVHDLEDELNDALDELNATQDDLDAVEAELDATQDDLDAVEAELDTTKDELNATQDDMNVIEEDLSSTSDDLDDARSQNLMLMAVLAVFAILAVVMSVMFFSLRKKIADMSGKSVEEEPPPPPKS